VKGSLIDQSHVSFGERDDPIRLSACDVRHDDATYQKIVKALEDVLTPL